MKGKKGDPVGNPFCLIDRRERNKVREGEEWEVEVVRTIKDRRGREVQIVRPVKRVLKVWDGRVFCGNIEVPAERRVVDITGKSSALHYYTVVMEYRVNGEVVGREERNLCPEEIVREEGEEWIKETVLIEEKIRRRRELLEKKRREEERRRSAETFEKRIKKRVNEIKKEIEEMVKHAKEQDLTERDTSHIKEEIKKIEEEIERVRRGLKAEVVEYGPSDGNHFIGLGREWTDGIRYTEGEVAKFFELGKKLNENLTLLRKIEKENERKRMIKEFIRAVEKGNPIRTEIIKEEGTCLITYPTPYGLKGEIVEKWSEKIEDISDLLEFADGIEDTAYPQTIKRFLEMKGMEV